MRYHGNYCGPNWSAGIAQPSVDSKLPSIDEFDETCKVHDAGYANGGDLNSLDDAFYDANIGKGVSRSIAAVAVKTQRLLRGNTRSKISSNQNMTLRGSTKPQQPTHKVEMKSNNKNNVVERNVPAIYGSVLRGSAVKQRKEKDGTLHMSTTVCIGKCLGASQASVPELIGTQYLHPVVLGSDEVQNMTRVYEQFRITRAHLRFRAFQGTGAGGEILVVANSDPNYRPINTANAASFYQRALSTEFSLLTPLWCPESMDLPVDSRWKVCDNSNSSTLEEFSSGVVYIYSDGTTFIPGWFLVDMDIEFKGLRFNSRQLISGSYQGLGSAKTMRFVAPTLNANAVITGSNFTPGDIYAIQITTTGSTFNAGSATTLLALSSGSGSLPYTITGSSVVYARASTTTLADIFTTYDAAIGGDNSDRLIYGVTSAATTDMPQCIITQLRNSAQPSL